MRRQELHPRTVVINKAQKIQSKKSRNEALAWLAQTFPDIFDNTLCIRPLKNGIMEDILLHADKAQAAGISRSKLREAVVLFTRRIDYLTCLKAREMRIDLNGDITEAVTEEEAERAATKIKKRVEKSARNARKTLLVKPSNAPTQSGKYNSYTKPTLVSTTSSSPTYYSKNGNEADPHYIERPPMFSSQHTTNQPAKAPAVIVKHKSARQYDPDAVARLKEKLGISRRAEEEVTSD